MPFTDHDIEALFDRLWPIPRSLAGPAFRESLQILTEHMPCEQLQFPTGSKVFDWNVPPEWEAREAYIVDPEGNRRADFKVNNLHLLGYSEPWSGTLPLEELREHIYTLPEQPDLIPYVTSYYKRRWGFCVAHDDLATWPEGNYQVHIDTSLNPGHVTVGEAILPGTDPQAGEILLSSYLCHPSMASNELSGPLVLVSLYQRLKSTPIRQTVRFILIPETIGSICYLSLRGQHLRKYLAGGLQITCVGDDGPLTYKRSRQGNAVIDRAVAVVLRDSGLPYQLRDFRPDLGSDERQWCSPGFNLPMGSLMRTPYLEYPQYHTSGDNKEYISFPAMVQTTDIYEQVLRAVSANRFWINQAPYGEPQLGKRGLYHNLTGKSWSQEHLAIRWLLNYSDGENDLLEIAERSAMPIDLLAELAEKLCEGQLLKSSTKYEPLKG